jgi:hypothetical protein
LKNQKPIAVDILFKAYSVVQLLWRPNLVWQLDIVNIYTGGENPERKRMPKVPLHAIDHSRELRGIRTASLGA